MAKTEKTTMRKSLLVDYFRDIIGEKGHKLSVNARDNGNSVHNAAFVRCNALAVLHGFIAIFGYVF